MFKVVMIIFAFELMLYKRCIYEHINIQNCNFLKFKQNLNDILLHAYISYFISQA